MFNETQGDFLKGRLAPVEKTTNTVMTLWLEQYWHDSLGRHVDLKILLGFITFSICLVIYFSVSS
jgi:hypothetical protein